jgi:parallel beta-helix repeat protein
MDFRHSAIDLWHLLRPRATAEDITVLKNNFDRSSKSTRKERIRHQASSVILSIMCMIWTGCVALTTQTASPTGSPSGSALSVGTDYYVSTSGSDSNDGSSASPWRTIGHASAQLKPGDTVHVLPGTYNESIFQMASGTATSRIRFISEQKWAAKIVATSYTSFEMRTGDYIDLVGFDLTGGNDSGVEVDTSHNKVLNNHVHDIPGNCVGGGGINVASFIYGQSDNLIDGNVVHNIGLNLDCAPNNAWFMHGIYISTYKATVSNNIVYAAGGYGIHLWHAAYNATIVNNTVFNNDAGGIILGGVASEYQGGPVADDFTTVANNISVGNGRVYGKSGIIELGATGIHNSYVNNLVFQNFPSNIILQNGLVAIGTITADPQFVNYLPGGGGDYHLQATSPAINAGTSSQAPTIDIDGGHRPFGSGWDIGTYEFGAAGQTWPWE